MLHLALRTKTLCQELQDADQFEPHLTLHIVKNLLKGGGASNELWRMHFLILVPQLDKALLDTAHMSKIDQQKELVDKKIDWQTVLKTAKTQYQRQKDEGEWLPARSARDPEP